MGQRIENRMIDKSDDFYYSDSFKTFLESHLLHLRNHETTLKITVNPGDAYLYQYDLSAFLLSPSFNNALNGNIPFCFHYLVMRLNGMTSAQEFTPETTSLLIPSLGYVTSLVRLFRTNIGQTG